MSMSLYLFSVRIRQISAVFGGGEESLIGRIRESSPARYRIRTWDHDALGGKERGELSIDEALDEIIQGAITKPSCAWQYGFALELICEHLGTELPNDEFAYLHAGIDEILQSAGLNGVAAQLLSAPRYPMPIPLIEDLPLISCLTMKEAAQDLAANGGLTTDGSIRTAASEQEKTVATFQSWLEHAASTYNDIVAFFY